MKTSSESKPRRAYHKPRLEVIALKSDEVLATNCKESLGGFGPEGSCYSLQGACATLGS